MAEPTMREILQAAVPPPAELPGFDAAAAPDSPVPLFLSWLADAVRDQVPSPQVMTLATADAAGRVDARVLICRDVDAAGRWSFASDTGSGKGRDLAANPHAAAVFYWPAHSRQVRVSGLTTPADGTADFLARSPDSRAAALAGRQSQPLGSPAELEAALRQARAAVDADPDLVPPTWRLYELAAETVEFWQENRQRRHVRLQYRRSGDGWARQLLWP